MNGGTISGNKATGSLPNGNGGGVVFSSNITSIFSMSDGTISGNTAGTDGGGVYFSGVFASFTKTGGTIYGNTMDGLTMEPTSLKNEAGGGSGLGHAVYIATGTLQRNSTAGPDDELKTSPPTGWDP
ncbi:MAG: hypothetical protein LBH35_08550 [Treponema sp.]|jgi:hypothetical protein|nr:hypothetical protein [Treponema sp.]